MVCKSLNIEYVKVLILVFAAEVMMSSVQVRPKEGLLWRRATLRCFRDPLVCTSFIQVRGAVRRERPEEQENPSRKDYWKLHVKFLPFSVESAISGI